jgi:hypothetical protein
MTNEPTANAIAVAKFRAENPERARSQTLEAGRRYRARKVIDSMTPAEQLIALGLDNKGETRP